MDAPGSWSSVDHPREKELKVSFDLVVRLSRGEVCLGSQSRSIRRSCIQSRDAT